MNKKDFKELVIEIISLLPDDIIITFRTHTGRKPIEKELNSEDELYEEE